MGLGGGGETESEWINSPSKRGVELNEKLLDKELEDIIYTVMDNTFFS